MKRLTSYFLVLKIYLLENILDPNCYIICNISLATEIFCFFGLCGPTLTFLSSSKYNEILIKEEKEKGCVNRHFILLGFSKDSDKCRRFHGDPFSSQPMIWQRKDK